MITGKQTQKQRIEPLPGEDARIEREALRLVLGTMPAAYLLNVPFAVVIAAALWLAGSRAGSVSLATVATVGVLQAIGSAAAYLIHRRGEVQLENPRRLTRHLVVMQSLVGLAWGASAWLCWREGSTINNVVIGMSFFSLTWSTATLRAAHFQVFLAGTLTLGGSFVLLFALSGGMAADMFLAMAPIWIFYIFRIGKSLRSRVQEMLHLRFANADLAAALALSRDDALAKKREVERANTAKSAFLANMSHELRTPLNAILGFSEIIARRLFDETPARYAEYAEDIHASGAHLLSLINDLLDISKIEAGRMEIDPQALDARDAVEEPMRLVRAKAEARRQELSCTVAWDAPAPFADPRAFKQITLNLLSNAIKYANEGSCIEASCARANDGGFLLCIADDGPGIPSDRLEGVFQPFDQVDNRYDRKVGGTGLGLALVRGLAELHGGRAWIESEYGRGTRAFVYLPLSNSDAAAPIRA